MKKINTTNTKSILHFSDVFGAPKTHAEVQIELMQKPEVWNVFKTFQPEIQEQLFEFFEGKRSLRILYDVFMQKLFHPYYQKERLESFLSSVINQNVQIRTVCPREGNRLAEEGSLTIMDIIVELENESLVNLEFQIYGYYFPGERGSCYLSDMIMRLYNKTKSQLGRNFSYRKMQPVYLIVMMDKSLSEFKDDKRHYIHHGKLKFDTDVSLKSLENIFYISLDNYRIMSENKNIESLQDAWLTFFSSDDPVQIMKLINQYPQFLSLYQEIAEFRKKPEDIIMDFSEALRIMDQNTVKYMIDDMQNQVSELEKVIDEKDKAIDELRAALVSAQSAKDGV